MYRACLESLFDSEKKCSYRVFFEGPNRAVVFFFSFQKWWANLVLEKSSGSGGGFIEKLTREFSEMMINCVSRPTHVWLPSTLRFRPPFAPNLAGWSEHAGKLFNPK